MAGHRIVSDETIASWRARFQKDPLALFDIKFESGRNPSYVFAVLMNTKRIDPNYIPREWNRRIAAKHYKVWRASKDPDYRPPEESSKRIRAEKEDVLYSKILADKAAAIQPYKNPLVWWTP